MLDRVKGPDPDNPCPAGRAPACSSPKSSKTRETAAQASSGKLLSRRTSFAPDSRIVLSTNSRFAPPSIGTGTAPCNSTPQNAATHCAEFAPHKITRSPGLISRSASRALQPSAADDSSAYVRDFRRYPCLSTTAASGPNFRKSSSSEMRFARFMPVTGDFTPARERPSLRLAPGHPCRSFPNHARRMPLKPRGFDRMLGGVPGLPVELASEIAGQKSSSVR